MILSDTVNAIATLPDTIIGKLQMLPSGNEAALLDSFKVEYRSQSLWLKHLTLGEQVATEGYEPPAIYYYPHSQMSAATLRLAIAVYPCSDFFQSAFESPAALWYICKFLECWRSLAGAGIISSLLEGEPVATLTTYVRSSKLIKGKEAWKRINSAVSRALADCQLSTDNFDKGIDWMGNLDYLLILEGQALAKSQGSFYRNTWNDYYATRRSVINAIREDPRYKQLYIDSNGNIKATAKHAKVSRNQL